ncbi:MAG: amidohydrolase family protein [Azospirillaceae bacterium]
MQILYSGARIFLPGGTLESGLALLVEGGRIARIAPAAEFEGYGGRTVTLEDATILPGLMDAHVHLVYGGEANPSAVVQNLSPAQIAIKAYLNARTALAGGITTLRDCGGKDYIEFAVRDACNRGDLLGPNILAAGRMICMTGGHGNKHGRIADGCDEVIKAVREQVHAGCDLIKIMATGGVMTPGVNPEDAHYTEDELRAGIAEGHRFHKHSASHAQGGEGILNAVRAGVDSIEHGIFLTQEGLEAMLERGTRLVPTLSAVNNILRHADQGIPAYAVEKSRRVAERHRQSIAMFYKAGGKLVMGTDAGTPFNFHGANTQELADMVEIGIAPADAVIAATQNAADLFGMADRGRLAEGAHADLLVVSGDPLADIARVADKDNHLMVVKNGIVAHARRQGTGELVQPLAAL